MESAPQLRILLICATPDDAIDQGIFELENSEIVRTTHALAVKLLRQQSFDVAVAIQHDTTQLETLLTAAPQNLAIVAAGPEPTATAAMRFCETFADEYLCLSGATSEQARWIILRAVERRQLLADAQQLRSARAQAQDEDHHAAIHQVRALRAVMLEEPESASTHPPEWLIAKLNQLLKAYVVSVSSNFHGDIEAFVEGLSQSGVTLHEMMMAHSLATEQILLGLGNRPGWHALGRSQILAHQLTMFFLKSLKPNSNASSMHWCETTLAAASE